MTMPTQYFYHTAQGKAILNKGGAHKLIQLGQFATERAATDACLAHHAKVCAAARNFGRAEPIAYYM